jgi:TetR/AcrR family transcriptional regulator
MIRRIDEDRLMEAALAEFGTRSYAEASVNTIIAKAGISKGSFYYRFAAKYDLYLHVLRTGVQRKWEHIDRELAAGSTNSAGPTPRDIFELFLLQARAGTAFALQYPEYHRLSIMLSREKGTELYRDVVRDLGQDDSGGLEDTVRAAIERGEIRNDLPEEMVVKMVTYLLTAFDEILFSDEEWTLESANERLEGFVRFLRHGLAPQ